jgi:hypothetical protein
MNQLGVVSAPQSISCQPSCFVPSSGSRPSGRTYVLVDKQDGNVFALVGELIKRCLDSRVFRLGIHDEEVLLVVGGLRDVLCASGPLALISSSPQPVLDYTTPPRFQRERRLTPTPASNSPVTESCRACVIMLATKRTWGSGAIPPRRR